VGFGKSICYTILPFVFDHRLGRVDQVVSLRAVGTSAAIITSGGGVQKALLATKDELKKCSILFCAPEA